MTITALERTSGVAIRVGLTADDAFCFTEAGFSAWATGKVSSNKLPKAIILWAHGRFELCIVPTDPPAKPLLRRILDYWQDFNSAMSLGPMQEPEVSMKTSHAKPTAVLFQRRMWRQGTI